MDGYYGLNKTVSVGYDNRMRKNPVVVADVKRYVVLSRRWNQLVDNCVIALAKGQKAVHSRLLSQANKIEPEMNHIFRKYDLSR
jgi:hypothetical protein